MALPAYPLNMSNILTFFGQFGNVLTMRVVVPTELARFPNVFVCRQPSIAQELWQHAKLYSQVQMLYHGKATDEGTQPTVRQSSYSVRWEQSVVHSKVSSGFRSESSLIRAELSRASSVNDSGLLLRNLNLT